LITLLGICRFEIKGEELSPKGYRSIKPEWKNFIADLSIAPKSQSVDKKKLGDLLRKYFTVHEIHADWEIILGIPSSDLISAIAMICPFATNEKQALLEATSDDERFKMLTSLLEMSSFQKNNGDKPHH